MENEKLIDRIKNAIDIAYWPQAAELMPPFMSVIKDPALPVVDVSNVAAYIGKHPDLYKKNAPEVIPCALPPFVLCWMEFDAAHLPMLRVWEKVGGLITSYDMRNASAEEKHKALDALTVDRDRREEIERLKWLVRGDFSSLGNDGVIGCLHTYAYFLVDAQGEILRPMLGGSRIDPAVMPDREDRRQLSRIAIEIMGVFGLATSFMTCKNVELIETQAPRYVRRQRQRERKPALTKFYTMNIEPMRRMLRTRGKSEEVGLKRAWHTCRGHFATYSPDRPLFGKVSGRFWFSEHERGSKDAGEVRKDYRVISPSQAA